MEKKTQTPAVVAGEFLLGSAKLTLILFGEGSIDTSATNTICFGPYRWQVAGGGITTTTLPPEFGVAGEIMEVKIFPKASVVPRGITRWNFVPEVADRVRFLAKGGRLLLELPYRKLTGAEAKCLIRACDVLESVGRQEGETETLPTTTGDSNVLRFRRP